MLKFLRTAVFDVLQRFPAGIAILPGGIAIRHPDEDAPILLSDVNAYIAAIIAWIHLHLELKLTS